MRTLLTGGLVYRQGGFVLADMAVKKGLVEAVSEHILPRPGDRVLDFSNCFLVPGFVDVHVHLREPGFSEKETVAYLLREIIPTTAVGIIVGIGAGAVMGYSILRSMEQSFVQFDRSVSFVAWGFGALIAIVFAAIVDWIVLRRIKGLKLTDAAV